MAVGDGSGAKSSEKLNDLPIFNVEKLQSNMKVILYSRTFLSIIGGIIAGISGFTGLTGFIFYFLVMAVTSVGLITKANFSVPSYFDSWNRVIFDGFLSGLLLYLSKGDLTYASLHLPLCYVRFASLALSSLDQHQLIPFNIMMLIIMY
ncbi:ER membrane protein complex subunit 6-like protein [Drosera capensis]